MMVKLDIPEDLPFDEADLCIILGNALDNALEACVRSDLDETWIRVIMRYDNGNLLILIENSFDDILAEAEEGKFRTSKKNKEFHGIGMQSIQRTAEKYHGFWDFSWDNKVFDMRIILYQE